MRQLFDSLNARRRPEDVAALVKAQLGERLSWKEKAVLQRAARGALRKHFGYTSMRQEFARPAGMQKQVATAHRFFPSAPIIDVTQCDDPVAVGDFVGHTSGEIGKAVGQNDFAHHRLSHQQRRESGLGLSRRQYNKRFRHLASMEKKLATLNREWKKHEFTKIGKSGLASRLSWQEFARDEETACFIAYYTARCNLRSEFTIFGQQKPYDEIADLLFARCRRAPGTNWWAIAQVYPSIEVLSHLSDAQKGELLGRWFTFLQEIAALLREIWDTSNINRQTMIVRRGNDSSTWNNTANAWNKARESWIALLYAMGAEGILDAMCVGKVLGLMAADVAMWHRMAGGGLHPDTPVWNELPLPWQVLADEASCSRRLVEEVCARHGVDAVKFGWTAPRPGGKVAPFRATPELVHGVTVGNPYLAKVLRQAGWFSGKANAHPVAGQSSEHLN